MKKVNKSPVWFVFALALVVAALLGFQLNGTEALAQSSYFTSAGCVDCHATPVVASCNGCHAHGTHASSSKSGINVTGTTSKTSYAPGEAVSVTIAGGYRTGWLRAVLYNQNTVELARSNGNASGMGGSTTYPATLSAPAPTAPGTYAWKVAWYGNQYDAGSATFGPGWTPDPNNPNHGYEIVSTNSFTVAAPADASAPVVGAFTLPASATSLTVPVSSLSATDNVAVTGYLVTTIASAPTAAAAGWSTTTPTSVTAAAAGNVTFYAFAKDAAGNVSAAKSASVTITLPDSTAPVVGAFSLPASATSLNVPVSSLSATDNVAVTGYLITTSASAPTAAAAGWSAAAPTSVTAAAAGNVTFYAFAKDAAGNVSAAKSASVTITLPDSTAPVVGIFTLPASATSLSVSVSSLSATDNVAVTGYLVTTSTSAPTAAAAGWSATAPSNVTAAAAGNVTFYAFAKDAAGNVSAAKSASVTITTATDTTKPTLTVSALANGSYTNKSTLNVSGNASDTGGIKSVTVNDQPVSVNPDGSFSYALTLTAGANTINIIATDVAGNQQTDTRTVTYDPNAPVLAVSAPADNSTTSQSFVAVTGTSSETSTVSVSVNGGSPQPAAITGNGYSATVYLVAGVNTIDITATDLAGNTATAKRTVTYGSSNSSLTLSVTNPSQDITTSNSSLVLKGKVSDGEQHVALTISMNGKTYTPKVDDGVFQQRLTFSTPKLYAITVTAKDAAGNKSTVLRNVIYRPGHNHEDD